ncbi:uncharacterized protein LOC131648626 [Vicia villosa]|uniref:uncharacterized protein LOC131648626 n=1 Tax=Vicia villosa TaxID=3911 RepID=UPI00273BED06|nr:uncharacterized protein LOC131648626 [Vicia villosa]
MFGIDLGCLPLDQIDVILGMNWLEYNHVYINCFDKTIIFLYSGVEKNLFLFAKQVNESVQDDVVLLALMETLDVWEKRAMGDLPIVRDIPEEFPEDVIDLPPEREMEFTIDLVPRTSPISMAFYHM